MIYSFWNSKYSHSESWLSIQGMWDFFLYVLVIQKGNKQDYSMAWKKRADWAEIRGNPQDCARTTCFSVVNLEEVMPQRRSSKTATSTQRHSSNTQRQNQEVPRHKKMLGDMFLSSAARTQRPTKSTVHSEPLRHAARTDLSNHNLRSRGIKRSLSGLSLRK